MESRPWQMICEHGGAERLSSHARVGCARCRRRT